MHASLACVNPVATALLLEHDAGQPARQLLPPPGLLPEDLPPPRDGDDPSSSTWFPALCTLSAASGPVCGCRRRPQPLVRCGRCAGEAHGVCM